MQYLKADTIATVLIGPFVDKGDGVTPEEGVTLAAADSAEIMKHDGTTFVDIAAANGNQCTLTHKEKGMYTLVIPAAVLDTEGRLTVFISDESVCLPVWKDFMVVNANIYDSLYAVAATDYLQVDLTQWLGVAPLALSSQYVRAKLAATPPTSAQIKTAIEAAGSHLALILADTDAISVAAIVAALLDEDVTGHETADTVGRVLGALMGDWEMVGNQLICKGLSGNVLFTFDLTRDGTPTEFNPDKREAA